MREDLGGSLLKPEISQKEKFYYILLVVKTKPAEHLFREDRYPEKHFESDKAMNYRFVLSKSKDAAWNLSLEEYMLDHVNDDEFIFYVWRNGKSLIIGRNQNAHAECNLKAIDEDGVRLVRRISGGGAVYFDDGNATYSFIAHKKNYSKKLNYGIIIDALKRLGLDTEQSGRNDILLDGKKISGNAFFNKGPRYLHHGTLLYNVNLADMGKYLNVSKKKLQSKGVKSVRSRVTNLIEHKPNLKYDDIVDAFYQQFCDVAGHKVDIVTLDEIRKDNPEAEKYYQRHISDEWKLGKNPEFNHSFDEKFDWGSVQFNFMVKDNRVKEVLVYTDSLLPDYFQKIDEVLLGEDYHSKSLIDAITYKINLDEFTKVDSKPDHELIRNIEQINKDLFILLNKSI